jgi:hypothetical protein
MSRIKNKATTLKAIYSQVEDERDVRKFSIRLLQSRRANFTRFQPK